MIIDLGNAKHSYAKGGSRRDDRLVIKGNESKISPIVRKSPKPVVEDGIGTLSRLTTTRVGKILIADKSMAFQQAPRSSINLLAGILDKYRLKDYKTILPFLKEHQNVANFLIKAHEKIREYFSSNSLQLRVSQDPEDPQLNLLVLSVVAKPDEVDESYEKLTVLEDELLLNASFEVNACLCIKLDFE